VTSALVRRAVSSTLVALILTVALPAAPARAMTGTITGKVVDSVTMQGIFDAHIIFGIPGGFIWAHSAADGSFTIDLTPIDYNPTTPWQVYFVKDGYNHGADEQVHHDNERLRLRFGAGERAGGLPAREAARRSALELHTTRPVSSHRRPSRRRCTCRTSREPRWRGWLVHAVHRAEHR